jgi:hypothetical protein
MIKQKVSKTDGARAFARYLKRTKTVLYAFCREHRLDYAQAHKAISGKAKRISVDFAVSVSDATDDDVQVKMWASRTER